MISCIKGIIIRCQHFRQNWIISRINFNSNSFFGTCSGKRKLLIRLEHVSGNISVTSVGSIFTVVSVSLVFRFDITEVFCNWDWELVMRIRLHSATIGFSVIIGLIRIISTKLWSVCLFAENAQNYKGGMLSVSSWIEVGYLGWALSSFFENGTNFCSKNDLENFRYNFDLKWSRQFDSYI